MSDLIDRQAAIDHFRIVIDATNTEHSGYNMGFVDGLEFCISHLSTMPSAQPERKTGKWISQDFNKRDGMISTLVYYCPKCSVCGHSANYTNFCPNCGAKMEVEEQDEAD